MTGMHRSGTSMLSGLMGICGLEIGTNFAPIEKAKIEGNEKGMFEDQDFKSINKNLLRRNGGGSFNPPKKLHVDKNIDFRIKAFLEKWNRPANAIVGWKDPRVCITLSIWKRYIKKNDLKIVLIYRPLEEVAQSLKKRNGYPIEKGLDVGRQYWSAIMENLGSTPFYITFYHDMLEDWITETGKICQFIGLEDPIYKANEIRKFVDPKLCHYGINK